MFAENALVALTRDIDELGLLRGAVGTIVHVYPDGAAYEVEFERIDGQQMPLTTLQSSDLRLATSREVGRATETVPAAK